MAVDQKDERSYMTPELLLPPLCWPCMLLFWLMHLRLTLSLLMLRSNAQMLCNMSQRR